MAEEFGRKRWIFVVYKRYDGGAKELILLELKEENRSLWWLENNVGKGDVGILVKEELCESVVEI